MSRYTTRWFERADLDDFVELYSDVFDTWSPSREWATWKYEANPYVDHVPIVVAERDGELVGARPFFGLPMSIGGERRIALQPADTMVQADHRGRGLFTRMTERSVDHYVDREPAFFFNFPNDRSRPGYEKLGWETVGEEARYYRIQGPERVLADRDDSVTDGIVGTIGSKLVGAYTRLCDEFADVPGDVSVERHSGVPVEELAGIYRRSVPRAIHAIREEQFLRWRFGNPNWEYSTYVTGGDPDPVAMVVGDARRLSTGVDVTRIVDTLPLDPDGADKQLLALLDRILKERAESDVIVTPTPGFPDDLMRCLGFYCDDWPPLKYVSRGRTHVARSTGDWEVDGVDIRDPENWLLSFVELDTS